MVGAEHVSFSALLTLAHGGARAVGMVTELPRHQSLALFRAGAALRFRTPLWTRTALSAIHGRPRVEEVELTDLDSGAVRRVACDTVVFTADWIPDHELAVMAGLAMDAGTRGPAVDAALRTSQARRLRGRQPASRCRDRRRGRARRAARRRPPRPRSSAEGRGWPEARVPVECEPPLRWIAPNAVVPGAGRAAARALRAPLGELRARPRVEIAQGGRTLWTGRVRAARARPLGAPAARMDGGGRPGRRGR